MSYVKIPKSVRVGGQVIEIRQVERCDEDSLGICRLAEGAIEIADIFHKDCKQSESGKVNTFYHELTHAILRTMGEYDLCNNEKFVCCFAGFLTDAMKNAEYKEEEEL